jgi:hypothetical protein
MAGYRFPFEAKAPNRFRAPSTANLKEDWGTIYEESIKQKLVRL